MKNILKIIGGIIFVTLAIAIFIYFSKNQEAFLPISNNTTQETEVDIKEKIGQLLIIGFRGVTADDNSTIAKTIKDLHPGGVILFDYDAPSKSFPRNIITPGQLKQLIGDLQSYSKTPLFVSVDAEGGNVNRLQAKYGFKGILSAQKMGEDKTLKTTKQESLKLAEELKSLGFNMNFAPVVDVNVNPKNPVIGALGRSFSSDQNVVTDNARVVIQNLVKNNIIPVAKHFPGHGSSTTDSHLGVVDVTKTYQEKELTPYDNLQKEGLLDAVMTAHIINQDIDKEYPATLSSLFIQNILRDQLGFKGVVISDDMQMNAIVVNYGAEDAMIRSINAGCDMLLLSNNGAAAYDEQLPHKAVNAIYKAVQEGKISKERIHESYERIMTLKKKFSIVH